MSLVSTKAGKKRRDFDPDKFLAMVGEARKIISFQKKQTIFAQGDVAGAVFYIRTGKVKLTVVSDGGKEATIAILNPAISSVRGALQASLSAWVRQLRLWIAL